ncbi:MAG: diguanylate cyclase [Anaerolineales bacterium]|nr:diguanylate cyclase [Anaerolineales bacterium]
MKVLLYSDDQSQINLVSERLNRDDYTLLVEQDSASLFGHLKSDLPELIISNFDLPNGGIDLVNSILALTQAPFPYMLFLTEEFSEKYAVDCLGPIPGDFAVKPVRGQELEARILVAERSIALQQRLLDQEGSLPDVAMYDDLTNLYNRQAIYEHALAEINRSQREKKPVCLVMIEINNGAEIQVKHGTEMYRQAVRFVARAIRANLRIYDLVGRWMEAKFFLILPGLSSEFGQSVLERILGAVHSINLRLEDGSLLDLDVAGGYTYAEPDSALPLYEHIEHANLALSQASELKAKPRVLAYPK